MTHFSPQIVARVATRTSTSLPSISVRELTVLWPAALDDVHAGHDLDAADEPDAHGGGQREHLLQCTVDPVAHADTEFRRFDVDVRSPVTHRLGEDAPDDLDDRGIVGHDVRREGRRVQVGRLRVPSTASKAWTRWSSPPMAR